MAEWPAVRAAIVDIAPIAVVKANGYGHGAVECARLFAAEGARMVTGVIEGAVTRLAKGYVHKGKVALKSFADSEIAPLAAFARKPEFVF